MACGRTLIGGDCGTRKKRSRDSAERSRHGVDAKVGGDSLASDRRKTVANETLDNFSRY